VLDLLAYRECGAYDIDDLILEGFAVYAGSLYAPMHVLSPDEVADVVSGICKVEPDSIGGLDVAYRVVMMGEAVVRIDYGWAAIVTW